MIVVALLVFAVVGVIGCIILEERGRPEFVVLVIIGIVVFDALVYPDGGNEPAGILRPTILGHDYRTADLVIVLALVARLFARGLPRRFTGMGLAWFAFFAMFLLAAPIGLANGHDSVLVIFQTKFVLEAGGMAILMAGVPLARVTNPDFVGKAAWTLGLASLAPILAAFAQHQVTVPLLPQAGFGSQLGADTATTLLSLAFLLLLVELCEQSPRLGVCSWCGLMIISGIVTGQRAALIGLVVTLLCALVVVVGRPWRRRSRARLGQLLPVVALLVIPLGTVAVLDRAHDAVLVGGARRLQPDRKLHGRRQDPVGRYPSAGLEPRASPRAGATALRLGTRPELQHLPEQRIGGSVHRR